MDKFTLAFNFVMDHEVGSAPNGGYTNRDIDPGGATKWGISDRRDGKMDNQTDVNGDRIPDIPVKDLTKQQAMEIYRNEYWKPAGCEDLPFELACTVFDTAVNQGVSVALKLKAQTLDYKAYLELRTQLYLRLAEKNPKFKLKKPGWKYCILDGWLARVNDLKKFVDIHKMDV